jgi:hypothetical protein
MIKCREYPLAVEHYSQNVLLLSGEKYRLEWESDILHYFTCHADMSVIECMDIDMKSLSIQQNLGGDIYGEKLTLIDFNNLNPNEELDFRCNCHGFTFANGKFWIADHFVDVILKDEFIEVKDIARINSKDYDIICLKDSAKGEWMHSGKYIYDLFLHKEGVRKFTVHASEDEVLSIPEYAGSEIHYFMKKDRSCPGICLNSIGEKHIKSFANSGSVL